ncbi:MAG: hypothetical protein GY774_35440 [Planctomycetes bacterium]|nr:hypothetical protein [Planctomycetota bacterium]
MQIREKEEITAPTDDGRNPWHGLIALILTSFIMWLLLIFAVLWSCDAHRKVDLGEIATTGDTNSIFTESSADKLLIEMEDIVIRDELEDYCKCLDDSFIPYSTTGQWLCNHSDYEWSDEAP